MSRKTILTFIAVLGAILGVIGSTLGLTLNGAAAASGLGAVLLYVLFEAKLDLKKLGAQAGKFKDPKFWLAIISAVIAALAQAGVTLPLSPELIVAILTAIMTALFGAKFKENANEIKEALAQDIAKEAFRKVHPAKSD